MADGSIIIDTLLRIDGYMKNMKKLHASQTKLKGQIEETTSKIDALEKEINDLNNSEVSSSKMDRLKEQISSCDKEAADLRDQMTKLESTQVPTQQFGELQEFITTTEGKLNKLLERESKMSDMGKKRTSSWKNLQYDIEETRNSLAHAKSEMEELKSGAWGGAYTSGANTSEYEKLSAKLSQITEKRQKYNATLDVTRVKEVQSKDTKIQKKRIEQEKLNRTLETQNAKYEEIDSKINSVSNSFSRLGAAARKNFNSKIAGATESCRKSVEKLSQSISRFTKRLLNVALSVFVFTVLTKAMTALKDRIGLLLKKNQQFSSSLAQIKGNLKTAFQSIYESALPALNSLMSVLAKVTAMIANFTAALFGKSVKASQEAAKAADNQAESVSGVGEAAKKASEYLNGYDEMNVQASSDSSGGGGGGSSSGTTYEDIDVDSGVGDFINRIKAAWEKADFTDIGRLIGTKIRDGLNGIDWEPIKTTASKLGTSLATLLNGVFETPGLFAVIGTTIAESLNTVLNGLYSFGKDFHWDSLGKGLSESINAFFKTFEFDKLGKAVHDWIAGGLTAATTFLKETDFEVIGNKIGEFLENLDIADLSAKFANLFWEAIKSGADLVKGLFEEAPIETSLITAFAVLKFTGLGTAIATKIGGAIATAFTESAFATTLSGAVSSIGATLVTAFTTDLPLLFGAGTFAECATAVFGGLVAAIAAAFVGWNLGKWLYENNVFGVGDMLDKIVENSGLGDLAVRIADFFEFDLPEIKVTIKGEIDEKAQQIKDWFADKKDDVKNFIANAKATVAEKFNEVKENFADKKDQVKDFIANAKGNVENSFNSVKQSWDMLKDGDIKGLIAKAKGNIENTFTNLQNAWNQYAPDSVKELTAKIKGDVQNSFSNLKSKWDALGEKGKDILATAKGEVQNSFTSLKQKWDKIKNKSPKIKAYAENKSKSVMTTLNKYWDKFQDTKATLTARFQDSFTKPLKAAWKILADQINKAIVTINKIPGVNITARVPYLAKGAVIPPNAPFLAMLGDQKNGTNIETPLNTMIEAFTAALDARNDSRNEPVINVYVGGQKITDYVIKDVKNRTIASGGMNPLLV